MTNEKIALIIVFVLMVLALIYMASNILNKDTSLRSPSSKTIKIFLWIVGLGLLVYFGYRWYTNYTIEKVYFEIENTETGEIFKRSTPFEKKIIPFRCKIRTIGDNPIRIEVKGLNNWVVILDDSVGYTPFPERDITDRFYITAAKRE
jgi:hypothetical protein